MNSKSLLALGGAFALVACAAFFLIKRPDAKESGASTTLTTDPVRNHATGSGPDSNNGASGPDSANKRNRPDSDHAELVAKYGESRTKLAEHVSRGIGSLMIEVIDLKEEMEGLAGDSSIDETLNPALDEKVEPLQLTEEQRKLVAALDKKHEERKIQEMKAFAEKISKKPAPLMNALLASDALSRGEITEEEFQHQLDLGNSTENDALRSIFNIKTSMMGDEQEDVFNDPQFAEEFRAILNAEQISEYDTMVAAMPENSGVNKKAIAPIKLEEMSATIESVQNVVSGARKMFEGVKNLGLDL